MAESGYDPKRSKVSDKTMTAWRQLQITGDLKEVPGIGDAAVRKLAESSDSLPSITTTYQLFGQFLSYKSSTTNAFTHMDIFWYFLKNKGISSHRSAIVKAVAEKASTFFPGLYDKNVYADEDDDDDEE